VSVAVEIAPHKAAPGGLFERPAALKGHRGAGRSSVKGATPMPSGTGEHGVEVERGHDGA
jgi:hypothetical protein